MKKKLTSLLIISFVLATPAKVVYGFDSVGDFTGEAFFAPPVIEQPKNVGTVEGKEDKHTVPPLKLLRLKLKNRAIEKESQIYELAPTASDVYKGEVGTSDYVSQEIKDKVDMFDIVLIDSTDPMGPGEGLFTEEFYTNVKRSLKKGGIVAAQSESPFVNKEEIKKMYNLLKKVFPICSTFTSNIPTYPGGYWAWAFCSEEVEPLSYFDERRAEAITKTCKIYNKEYHNARFALPNYLKELL